MARRLLAPLTCYAKSHRALLAFVLLLGMFRGYLATSGHLFWPDEKLHIHSVHFVNHLAKGNLNKAIFHVFNARGRPGYVLLTSVPVAAQKVLLRLGLVEKGSPHSFDVFGFYNVLFTLATTIVLYHVLIILLRNGGLALLGTVVYGLLCNSNVYVKHLAPYESALFACMLGLLLVLRAGEPANMTLRTAGACGLLAAMGYATYPGYYAFVIILGVAVFALSERRVAMTLAYGAAGAAVATMMELTAMIAGKSFLFNAGRTFADFKTMIQGSHEEGFVFGPRYVATVEGWIGYLLMALFAVYLVAILPRHRSRLGPIVLAAIAGYLLHGTITYFFHKLMFYGRIVHMYVPFLVMGAMVTLDRIGHRTARRWAMACVTCVSLICFAQFANSYVRVRFPVDIEYELRQTYPDRNVLRFNEVNGPVDSNPSDYDVVAVNVNEFYCPIPEEVLAPNLPTNMKLIESYPHPLSMVAYPFEGASTECRNRFAERDLHMRIYAKPDP